MKIISQKQVSLKYLDLKAVAKAVSRIIPKSIGFAIVFFEFNKEETTVRYISNAPRNDMQNVLTGLVDNWKKDAKKDS